MLSVPTLTGLGTVPCVTPFPNWPLALHPHAHRLPSVFTARVKSYPAETDFHVPAAEGTGADLKSVLPFPN